VPAGLDEDDRTVWFQSRVEVVSVPIPDAFSVCCAFRLGTVLYRVVNDHELRAETGYAGSDPDGFDSSAEGGFPL
jgi:hypothetical protein